MLLDYSLDWSPSFCFIFCYLETLVLYNILLVLVDELV